MSLLVKYALISVLSETEINDECVDVCKNSDFSISLDASVLLPAGVSSQGNAPSCSSPLPPPSSTPPRTPSPDAPVLGGALARLHIGVLARDGAWHATCVFTIHVEGEEASAPACLRNPHLLPVLRTDACGQIFDTGLLGGANSAGLVSLGDAMQNMTFAQDASQRVPHVPAWQPKPSSWHESDSSWAVAMRRTGPDDKRPYAKGFGFKLAVRKMRVEEASVRLLCASEAQVRDTRLMPPFK